MRDVWRTGGVRGLRGETERGWMGCYLVDLRAFRTRADQWTTAARNEGDQRKTAEQEAAECFNSK